MEEFTGVTHLLTEMIIPAILIMACGSLSLTTSQRLSRSIDRTRKISAEFKEIKKGNNKASVGEKRMLYQQLQSSIRRSRLLQRAMTLLYIALGFFISTSLFIGFFAIVRMYSIWVLTILPMLGAISLLSSSIFLIMETRIALHAVDEEMKYRMHSLREFFDQINVDPDV